MINSALSAETLQEDDLCFEVCARFRQVEPASCRSS